MKRNSTTIFIESPSGDPANPCLTPIPWVSNAPDFTGIAEPTLSVLQSVYEAQKGDIQVIPDPVPTPVVVVPGWDALQARLLAGDLNPIFARLTVAAIDSNPLSTARGDVTDAILTVRVEAALASAIALLKFVGWVFTAEEVALWNGRVAELGFSAVVEI
jgi:hypothetical protein